METPMPAPALNIPSRQGQVSPEEWRLRVDLAAAYRLVARFGWDDLVFTHISAASAGHRARLPHQPLRPAVRGDHRVQPGEDRSRRQEAADSALTTINPAGFTIHSAMHAARADAQCVLHTHSA
jgi:ribulose-5-phosphate 4-epimerase/fuculose-1-phosphate aldolase